jgi:hypothetical protein
MLVRGTSRRIVAGLVALLLALGLMACGGGDDADTTATESATQTQADGGDTGSNESAESGAEGEAGSEADEESGDSGSDDFTPKQHDDSGGGSDQFKAKGGDNSIQEFGNEADDSERDAAAEALHNFLDARAEEAWAAACSYMSKQIADSLEKLAARAKQIDDKSCGGVLEKLTNPAASQALKAEAAAADVGSLRTDGERSFILYTGTEGTVLAMPMEDEGGDWKVASLAGTPIN